MKKENILRAVRIIVLVIFCLFAAKIFIGKNGSGSNDSNLTAATKKKKFQKKIVPVQIPETAAKILRKRKKKRKKQKFRRKNLLIPEIENTK